MKARSASIITSPNDQFTRRIDPLTGRVFVDTLGNVVASSLSAIADKAIAIVRYVNKAAIDAAIAASSQAMHEVRILGPDTLDNLGIYNGVGAGQKSQLVPQASTSRSKLWGFTGYPVVVSKPNGNPPSPLSSALYVSLTVPMPSGATVSQVIQMIGDEIEAARAANVPSLTHDVVLAIGQNAAQMVFVEKADDLTDESFEALVATFGVAQIAKIMVASNDLPVLASGAAFGE